MRILRGQRIKFLPLTLRNSTALVLKDKVRTADEHLFALDHAGNTVCDDILHLRMVFLVLESPLFCLLHDGIGHGVRIMLLQTGGQAQHFGLLMAAEGHDLRDLRPGVGQRAGLVEHDRIGLRHGLQKTSALDGNVIAAALAHGREHRNGHGQLQSAREIDHQHGQHLCHIARDEIRQRRAAQRIRDQTVGKARGLVLGGGFELFGFLDHAYDAVIAAAAERLFHAHDALALFHDRPGVDIAAVPLRRGHGLAGDGRLIDRRLAGNDPAVERNEIAGTHDHPVAGLHVADEDKQLRLARLEPYLVDVQRHCARKIRNGLLVRPLLQNFAQPQHEHDGARGVEVAAHHRDGHGGRIEHGDGKPAVQQGAQTCADVLDRAEQGDRRPHRDGQEQPRERAAADGKDELVLILAVERAGRMLRQAGNRPLRCEGERRKRPHDVRARVGIGDDGVLRPVEDLDGRDAANALQIIFQQIRFAQRHAAKREMHAHTPGRLMQNVTLHMLVCTSENRRAAKTALLSVSKSLFAPLRQIEREGGSLPPSRFPCCSVIQLLSVVF